MSIKEIRDILYCHLMDIEAGVEKTWDYDVIQVKSALQETVVFYDTLLAQYGKISAK